VYETEMNRALLSGYDEAWLWAARLGDQEAGASIAEQWRQAVLATGGFVEVPLQQGEDIPSNDAGDPGGDCLHASTTKNEALHATRMENADD
jgi:hypothetical protein